MELSGYQKQLIRKWIDKVEYVVVGRKTTVCCLTLCNGFEIIGKSACVNPLDFDKDLGESNAFKDALLILSEIDGFARQNEVVQGVELGEN